MEAAGDIVFADYIGKAAVPCPPGGAPETQNCEGKSQGVETRTYRSHNISAKCASFAIRFAALWDPDA